MCGRYVTPAESAIEREYDLRGIRTERFLRLGFAQNFDTRPTNQVPVMREVVRLNAQRARELLPMRWGLIPHFARGVAGGYATFNARIETIRTAPSYRGPWKRGQRCLILAAGFYEWQAQPPDWQRTTQYLITLAGHEVFAMAGLWDASATEAGEEILSCTIITMPANELMRTIHNSRRKGSQRELLPEAERRMPAILLKEHEATWLGGSAAEAWAVLAPCPPALMQARPVARAARRA